MYRRQCLLHVLKCLSESFLFKTGCWQFLEVSSADIGTWLSLKANETKNNSGKVKTSKQTEVTDFFLSLNLFVCMSVFGPPGCCVRFGSVLPVTNNENMCTDSKRVCSTRHAEVDRGCMSLFIACETDWGQIINCTDQLFLWCKKTTKEWPQWWKKYSDPSLK